MSLRLYHTNLDSLVDTMLSDALFSTFRPSRSTRQLESSGFADVKEGDDGTTITMEIPGVSQSDLEVTLHDGLLTIGGKSRTGKSYRYSRSVDPKTNDSEITASLSDGILEVFVPRMKDAAPQPKKIPITLRA